MLPSRRQQPGRERAEQDRKKRPHLHQRVAADQLRVFEHLRQHAVLRGREERRMHAHQEQRAEQHCDAVRDEAQRRNRHDDDLRRLDHLQHQRFVEAVGELAGDA